MHSCGAGVSGSIVGLLKGRARVCVWWREGVAGLVLAH